MSSSISSSDRRIRSRYRRHTLEFACIAVFAVAFTFLTLSWQLVPQSIAHRFYPLAAAATIPPSSDWYLGYFNGDVEHFAIYDDIGGAAETLRHADVLFLGNSRMKYAFRDRDVLGRFFRERGLSYFMLAFGFGEGGEFADDIIRRYDLHPKWVVVNADPFFGTPLTGVAAKAIAFGRLEGWKTEFEAETALAVQHYLHQFFPYVTASQLDGIAQWVEFRAKSDGTIWPVAWRGTPSVVVPPAGASRAGPISPATLAIAESFNGEIEKRGAHLVLTSIPPSSNDTAMALASSLAVPLLTPPYDGLSTLDGSHLDSASARHVSESLLAQLGKVMDAQQRSGSDRPP